jgi:ABC-type transport system involved in multi-copper enzyme maturation permease subunit
MKKVIKVAENEFYRLIKSKKVLIIALFVCLLCGIAVTAYSEMSANILSNLPIAEKYPADLKEVLRNLDSVSFVKLCATDFIYKPYFSFYAIFIVLLAVDIFAIDKESGTLKFTKLSGVSFGEIYAGKMLAAFIICTALAFFNFTVAFLFGLINNPISFHGILGAALIYLCAALPGTALILIIALLSFLPTNSKILIGGGVLVVIILGTADTIGAGKLFSPIGLLSVFGNSVPYLGKDFLISAAVSAVYCILLSVSLLFISKRVDYFD